MATEQKEQMNTLRQNERTTEQSSIEANSVLPCAFSIVPKELRITVYDRTISGYIAHFSEYFDSDGRITSTAHSGITEEKAKTCPVKAVYVDDDAKRWLWQHQFNNLDEKEREVIIAVFPDILERDYAQLKNARKVYSIAREKIRKHFGETCRRCCGSGNYALSVAYTLVDDGVCHKCGGTGKQMPKLTAKKLAEIREFFSGGKQ